VNGTWQLGHSVGTLISVRYPYTEFLVNAIGNVMSQCLHRKSSSVIVSLSSVSRLSCIDLDSKFLWSMSTECRLFEFSDAIADDCRDFVKSVIKESNLDRFEINEFKSIWLHEVEEFIHRFICFLWRITVVVSAVGADCLRDHFSIYMVPEAGIEPAWWKPPRDFKSLASASFATPTLFNFQRGSFVISSCCCSSLIFSCICVSSSRI
jgi:hypothetical protein